LGRSAGGEGGSRPGGAGRTAGTRTRDEDDPDERHGRLHLANPNSANSTLIEEGKATGTLPRTVRAHLTVSTSTVRVSFTIILRGASITVSHGTGHYGHASGSGRLSGTILPTNAKFTANSKFPPPQRDRPYRLPARKLPIRRRLCL